MWPTSWMSRDSKSSDTNLIGFESSKVDPAAAQHRTNRIDDTKLTRPMFPRTLGGLRDTQNMLLLGGIMCVSMYEY